MVSSGMEIYYKGEFGRGRWTQLDFIRGWCRARSPLPRSHETSVTRGRGPTAVYDPPCCLALSCMTASAPFASASLSPATPRRSPVTILAGDAVGKEVCKEGSGSVAKSFIRPAGSQPPSGSAIVDRHSLTLFHVEPSEAQTPVNMLIYARAHPEYMVPKSIVCAVRQTTCCDFSFVTASGCART